VQPRVTDVERLKKQVRKMAAGRVLAGGGGEACLDLAQMQGCRVAVTAAFGPAGKSAQSVPHDRLLWILDGFVDVQTTDGQVIRVSQGESTVLSGGVAYHLIFPQLTVYLLVEGPEKA
jgi:uncharacterized cupin superfamily protein